MDKYYVIRFTGKEPIVDLLDKYVPRTSDTLSRAREIRSAVKVLFGDGVQVEIMGQSPRSL